MTSGCVTVHDKFAQQAQSDTSERSFTNLVPEAYCDFEDVFSKDAFNELLPCKVWDHAIDLIPDAELPRSCTFPLSLTKRQELELRHSLTIRQHAKQWHQCVQLCLGLAQPQTENECVLL